MSDINDMIEWLGGVLDRREDTANDAGRHDGQWKRDGLASVVDAAGRPVVFSDRGLTAPEQADHIALNDPKQILADVAADRAILRLHYEAELNDGEQDVGAGCGECHHLDWSCETLRLITAKYATWPGYRTEWAPEANRG